MLIFLQLDSSQMRFKIKIKLKIEKIVHEPNKGRQQVLL